MPCCIDCGTKLLAGENWLLSSKRYSMYRCTGCKRAKANKISSSYNPLGNPKRMYVNGKYVPSSHPLYKPGRYKSFNDAAFSSLQNYKTTKAGYVYVITNTAWHGWVKVGMAVDADDRLSSYQTSSPFRDYELQYSVYCKDRRKLESKAHKAVGSIASDRNNEWFKASVEDAVDCITGIIK
tara:strand:- start:853 stop:1395 length:543 start_codon:yes stop_codon:yes gene_type:complete